LLGNETKALRSYGDLQRRLSGLSKALIGFSDCLRVQDQGLGQPDFLALSAV